MNRQVRGFSTGRRVSVEAAFWGADAFTEGARERMACEFDAIGVQLDASGVVPNGRAYGVRRERRVAQADGLRRSVRRSVKDRGQRVWSILDSERRQAKAVWGPKVH
jgi:hypothetical protein